MAAVIEPIVGARAGDLAEQARLAEAMAVYERLDANPTDPPDQRIVIGICMEGPNKAEMARETGVRRTTVTVWTRRYVQAPGPHTT